MVPSPRQCLGHSGKVCNRFLPSRDSDPYCLCTSCRGKVCIIWDICKDCHDWPDEKCHRVGEYIAKLSVQRERKKERQMKAFCASAFVSVTIPLWHECGYICGFSVGVCGYFFGCYSRFFCCAFCACDWRCIRWYCSGHWRSHSLLHHGYAVLETVQVTPLRWCA